MDTVHKSFLSIQSIFIAVAVVCPLMVASAPDQSDPKDLELAESKPEAYLVHLKPKQQLSASPSNRKSKMLLLLRLPESEQQQESFISQQTQALSGQTFELGPSDVQQKEQSADFEQQAQQENLFDQQQQTDQADEQKSDVFEEQRDAGSQQLSEQRQPQQAREESFQQAPQQVQQQSQQVSQDQTSDEEGFDDETSIPTTVRPQLFQTAIRNGFRPMLSQPNFVNQPRNFAVKGSSRRFNNFQQQVQQQQQKTSVQSIAQNTFDTQDQQQEQPVRAPVQKVNHHDFGRKGVPQAPIQQQQDVEIQRNSIKSAPKAPRSGVKGPAFPRTQQFVQQEPISTTQRAPVKSAVKSTAFQSGLKSPVQQRPLAEQPRKGGQQIRGPVQSGVKSTQKLPSLTQKRQEDLPVKTAQRTFSYEAPIRRTPSKTSLPASPIQSVRQPSKTREPVVQQQEQFRETFTTVQTPINDFQQEQVQDSFDEQRQDVQEQKSEQEKKVPVILVAIPPESSPFAQQKDNSFEAPIEQQQQAFRPISQERDVQLPAAPVKGQTPLRRPTFLTQLQEPVKSIRQPSRGATKSQILQAPVQQIQQSPQLPLEETGNKEDSFEAPVEPQRTEQITQQNNFEFSQEFQQQQPQQAQQPQQQPQQQQQQQQQQDDFNDEDDEQRQQKVALVIPTYKRGFNSDVRGKVNQERSFPQQNLEQFRLPEQQAELGLIQNFRQQQEAKSPVQSFNPQEERRFNQFQTQSNFNNLNQANRQLPLPPALSRAKPFFNPPTTTQPPREFLSMNQQYQSESDSFSASQNDPIFDDENESLSSDDIGNYGLRNNAAYETAASSQRASGQQPSNGRMVLLFFDKGHIASNQQNLMTRAEAY